MGTIVYMSSYVITMSVLLCKVSMKSFQQSFEIDTCTVYVLICFIIFLNLF